MIMYFALVLLLLPLVAGVESLFLKREQVWALSALSGVCIGGFAWNAHEYWIAFPAVSITLVILSAAMILRLAWLKRGILARGVAVATITVAGLLLSWNGLLTAFVVNAEVPSDIEVLNPTGASGTALMVYHPGRSSFPRIIHHAFAEGLASTGWRVEITTASSQAPTDLSGYNLLILGTPTYNWLPSQPIQQYIHRLGDLRGKPTIAIVSAEGYYGVSLPAMEQLVHRANGNLIRSIALTTGYNNVDGITNPVEIMHRAAKEISLGGK